MTEQIAFEIVHGIRVRGFAAAAAIEAAVVDATDNVTAELDRLVAQELIQHREVGARAGWLLTSEGLTWHGEELAARSDDAFLGAVGAGYRQFLKVNRPFKELCSDWQAAGSPADGAPAMAEELGELAGPVHGALRTAATSAGWFAAYGPRLDHAIEQFGAGDLQFLINPRVDSVHTIWGECHEDFLVSLARERTDEDE
jgi:hypothetical protein